MCHSARVSGTQRSCHRSTRHAGSLSTAGCRAPAAPSLRRERGLFESPGLRESLGVRCSQEGLRHKRAPGCCLVRQRLPVTVLSRTIPSLSYTHACTHTERRKGHSSLFLCWKKIKECTLSVRGDAPPFTRCQREPDGVLSGLCLGRRKVQGHGGL